MRKGAAVMGWDDVPVALAALVAGWNSRGWVFGLANFLLFQ